MHSQTFKLTIDGKSYRVSAEPSDFNEGTRYTVQNKGSDDFMIGWDSKVKQYRAIDNNGSQVPSNVEIAISHKLIEMNN